MHPPATHPEAEPLGWRDIEALPYYALVALGVAGAAQALAAAGPELQAVTVKAMLIAGILVLRHALLRWTMTRDGLRL